MRKILISSLGTGQKRDGGYQKAKYSFSDKDKDKEIEIETTFISKALKEFLAIDDIFLVGTNGSIWDSCYREFGGKDEDIELELLNKIDKKIITEHDLMIVNQQMGNNSKCFLIDYGLNENELWENFAKYLSILDHIQDGDIVYVDISHAFRSLALMSFLMVQFGFGVKNKKFTIGGIYYGMLEAAKEGITPIVDLKIFYDLMEWIKAIDAFKNYGHADLLVKLFENETNLDHQEKEIFNMFDLNLSLANMSALQKFIENAKRILPKLKKHNNPIIKLISPDIVTFVERMDIQPQSKFQFELASWFCENKNYALTYTVLVEALVTKQCEKDSIDSKLKDNRERAKKSLWNGSFSSYPKIVGTRNDIAHQRDSKHADTKKNVSDLKDYLTEAKKFIY
ncbi:MAG: TIGR02221 family CRISPR-associated protein [Sulfuricurvum sp.]